MMKPVLADWDSITDIGHISYKCGHCNETTGIRKGYGNALGNYKIYLCGGCNRPSYFEIFPGNRYQVPAPIAGNAVDNLPEEIDNLFTQARKCIQIEAYTACVLVCRKILMHIAVEKEAPPNQQFISYVKYLSDCGYVPPDGKGWVDEIRLRGNEANHEIVLVSLDDAIELLSFVEMLLIFVFNFPSRIQSNAK